MSDLTAFLKARLAEDHAAAVARWRTEDGPALGARRDFSEVEAKRAILAAHLHRSEEHASGFGCDTCHWDREYGMPPGVEWCATLRALAAIYSDHPDYDETWQLREEPSAGIGPGLLGIPGNPGL